jgi:hypothetical protein
VALAEGGDALAVPAGEVYVDVGTLNGYREAMRVLGEQNDETIYHVNPANLVNPVNNLLLK